MDNPFSPSYPDQTDTDLVQQALQGDKQALQQLLVRHQVFVYNLAFKMTRRVEDAEDLTQEVLIKAMTNLGAFQARSRFRTWLYRIAVNHFLNTRKRKSEVQIVDFETYFNGIDAMPDNEPNEAEKPEWAGAVEELRVRCTAGMLLCLNREQRLVFILGDMFGVDHQLGSEIMGITPGNFRIRLMRARQDLYEWMNRRCGLVNQANPCRCARKTRAYVEAGFVDPQNLQFTTNHRLKIFELSAQTATPLVETMEDLHRQLFTSHPLQEPQKGELVEELLNQDLLKQLLNY